jgi:4-hydroxythreonine-4-phosphate dehydrogenase
LELKDYCKPVLIGDLGILRMTANKLNVNLEFKVLMSPSEAEGTKGSIELIDLANVDLNNLKVGEISFEAGKASLEYIEKAVKFALNFEVDAVVTAPINKKAIQLAGSKHIGHTEILSSLCGIRDPLTMFWVLGARIFFLSRHLALSEAIKMVRKKKIVETTIRIEKILNQIGIKEPKIAIATLNPHASDMGLIGNEEENQIIPAVKELQKKRFRVFWPISADSVFHQALEGKYDAVFSLYHDQGHIAAKTIDFYGTVSVTLGLPFIRTSVDHGTAYEIAGKGIANPRSLQKTIELAAKISKKENSRRQK